MYLEDNRLIRERAAHSTSSKTFHLIGESPNKFLSGEIVLCGSSKKLDEYSDSQIRNVQVLLDENYKPCRNCLKQLKIVYDQEFKVCDTCKRPSIFHDDEFETLELLHAYGEPEQTTICPDCKKIIGA